MKICSLLLSVGVLIPLFEFGTTGNSKPGYQYDVLLGGESDSPLKTQAMKTLTDLNLNVTENHDSMTIKERNEAIEKSKILLYVLDKSSRNSLTMNEVAYLLGKRCGSLIVVFTLYGLNQMIQSEKLSNEERYDLNYGMDVLQYLALRHHVKIFQTLDSAIDYIRTAFHNVETNDNDDDDLLDEQCMSVMKEDIEDAEDDIFEETTTETIEVTTITEKTTTYQEDTDFFSSQRRRRSPENEGTSDDEDSQTTSDDDDDDNDDDDDDDDDYLSDQCEIETDFDLHDTIVPRYNSIINQANKDPNLDELFAKALERQNEIHQHSLDKVDPKYAWNELQASRICPEFLPITQERLKASPNPIDKKAFELIAKDCMNFQKETAGTCKAWGDGNAGKKSSLYYGAFNLNTTEKPKYCEALTDKNVLCYAPNLNYYDISQMSIEIEHLNSSRSKLFMLPRNNYATGLTLMVSYLIGVKADKLFLYLPKINITKDDNSKRFTPISVSDYNRGRVYLYHLANSTGVKMYTKNHEALEAAISGSKLLTTN